MARTERTALITGASAGLGRELARLAAKDGHDVVLVARRRDRLEELAKELETAYGMKATVLAADLGERVVPSAIADELHAKGIAVDFLINNAGFGTRGSFVHSDLARELEMVEVNIRALMQLTRLFLPDMIARKRGRILNIASVAGFLPGPYMATYYASKAFVLSFTEALSAELAGTGVTVTASCPGPTATEFGSVAGSDKTKLFQSNVAQVEPVARHAYKAMMAGTIVAVPGLMNKLIAQSVRISPKSVLRSIAAGLNRKRKPGP
jgi:short-subunit dehydrogenase